MKLEAPQRKGDKYSVQVQEKQDAKIKVIEAGTRVWKQLAVHAVTIVAVSILSKLAIDYFSCKLEPINFNIIRRDICTLDQKPYSIKIENGTFFIKRMFKSLPQRSSMCMPEDLKTGLNVLKAVPGFILKNLESPLTNLFGIYGMGLSFDEKKIPISSEKDTNKNKFQNIRLVDRRVSGYGLKALLFTLPSLGVISNFVEKNFYPTTSPVLNALNPAIVKTILVAGQFLLTIPYLKFNDWLVDKIFHRGENIIDANSPKGKEIAKLLPKPAVVQPEAQPTVDADALKEILFRNQAASIA